MDFISVHTLDEAVAVLGRLGDDATVLAGGSDVMVQLERGDLRPSTLVHIEPLTELVGTERNGHLRLGALATHRTIATSPVVAQRHRSLAAAAALVGGWQTQAVGTIGGNIVNASPAADLIPPLLVHGATVTLSSSAGDRTLALDSFITGRRQTARRGDELLTFVDLEEPPARTADSFVKVGRRSAMEVSIVAVAVRLTLAADTTTVEDVRIAVCSCGPRAFRAHDAERALLGQTIDADTLRAAGAVLLAQATPIDDVRASAAYRRRVLPRVLARAVAECAGTIRGAAGVAA